MLEDSCSRREFLRKFAVVSTGTLVLGTTAIACYGTIAPNAARSSTVPMFYLDPAMAGILVPLRDNQDVSMDAEFRIDLQDAVYFSNLSEGVTGAIYFAKAAGEPVDFRQSWVEGRYISVAPTMRLAPATAHILRLTQVTLGANKGTQLIDNATANFRTRPV